MQITRNSYAKSNNPKKLPVYNGITTIKASGVQEAYTEWEIEEYKKCKASPEYFIENYIVLDGEKGAERFKLYDYQRDAITDIKENKYTIVLAPRRAGKSVTILGFCCWYAVFNSHKNVYLLSKDHEASKLLLAKLKSMYESLPFFLQPGVENYAVEKVELSTGTKLITAPSRGVRGDDADILLLDEFAHLPGASMFFQATYPIISKREHSKLIIVSTPLGMSGEFSNIYHSAVKRTNHFLPIKWHYTQIPGYDEAFKQETIANIGQERWDTEFECKFLTGSKTLIDGQVLSRLDIIEPIKTYSKNFKVYEEPKPKSKYIISVDVGDGVGKDYSVIQIVDISMKPYKVVMTYRDNKVSPFELDTIVVMWAKRYNNGFVVVETNNRGADVANRILNDHFYENIFIKDASKPTGYGIDVKETNKKKGCSILKNMIETNMLVINDSDTVRELKTFEITKTGSYAAANGLHDDTVMSLVVFCLLTAEPIFIDLQGSDKDINETIKDIKVASLPQEFMLEGFITNYSDPFSDVKNYADYFSRGNDNQYDGLNYYNIDWE